MNELINILTTKLNKPFLLNECLYILEKNKYISNNKITSSGKALLKLLKEKYRG